MERTTSLSYEPERMNELMLALYLPPYNEYRCRVANFLSTNANKAWQAEGSFFATAEVYVEGRQVARVHSQCFDQKGYLSIPLEDVSRLIPEQTSALVVIRFHHERKIPLETYATYQHVETGVYASLPVGGFIGDAVYTHTHAETLENTLFWPGVVSNDSTESCLMVLNPFKVNFSYQLSLYTPEGARVQSEVYQVKRYSYAFHALEEVFGKALTENTAAGDKFTVCIGAQYKVVAYFGIRDREKKYFTTMDHMHPFILV